MSQWEQGKKSYFLRIFEKFLPFPLRGQIVEQNMEAQKEGAEL